MKGEGAENMTYWCISGLGCHFHHEKGQKERDGGGEFNAVKIGNIGLYVENIKTCILELDIYNLFWDNGNKHILR